MENKEHFGPMDAKSPTLNSRSPKRRRTIDNRQPMSKEEKTYRDIMGADGKIKPQFEHYLIDLEVDSDDLFDK